MRVLTRWVVVASAVLLAATGCGSSGGGVDADQQVSDLSLPAVQGEVSAGHADPTWIWSAPDGATALRYRLDGGRWTIVPATTTGYTAFALSAGLHTFEVQARDGLGRWTPSSIFRTTVEYHGSPGCWKGVARALSTTPEGHVCAVNAHNAYAHDTAASPQTNVGDTLAMLHDHQAGDVDCLELDVRVDTVTGIWYLVHDPHPDLSSFAAPLSDVLADPALQAGDQLLFLEMKQSVVSKSHVRDLLQLFADAGYAVNGRPVVFRSFYFRQGGQHVLDVRAEPGFLPLHSPYFKVHALFSRAVVTHDLVVDAAADGYDGIEFEAGKGWTGSAFGLIRLAQQLNLCVGQWTIAGDDEDPDTADYGDVWVHAFRNELDVITTDYDPDASVTGVEENASIFYLNVWDEPAGATSIPWREGVTVRSIQVGNANEPALVEHGSQTVFEDMTGSVLHFVSATSEALVFHDGDCRADEGYFVAALVNFDDLDALAPNTTYGILSKAESGGFTLELHTNALGRPALRFGVYVGGDYVYAETDAGGFDDTASYLIVGCYDGDGFVSLHVDGALAAESTAIQGGVVNNDAPIVLGASPAGSAGASQHHFSGKIQMAQVQHWREHR